MVLYHKTNSESAMAILRDGFMEATCFLGTMPKSK